MMQKNTVKIIKRELIATNTMLLTVSRPAGWQYQAGQFTNIILPNTVVPDDRGGIRSMSLASAPRETDLLFLMRISKSGFKQTLYRQPAGWKFDITPAVGRWLWPQDKKPVIFLVGGIGIAPVRSLLVQASKDKQDNRSLFLFYANHTQDGSPWLGMWQNWSAVDWHFVPTMTRLAKKDSWAGERGYFSVDMIQKYWRDDHQAWYYVVGPQRFVRDMKQLLYKLNISPERIKVEEFFGY
ncbi:MAG: FAD-dependent oxidoreductase [Candidatus Komeilibacteria bacterium]